MGPHRKALRLNADRHHLTLIRGGLDGPTGLDGVSNPCGRASDGGPDWQAFCERIGWAAGPEAPSDLEESVLAKVLGHTAGDEPVDAICEAQASVAQRARAPKRRWAAIAVTLAAAAAALIGLATTPTLGPRGAAVATASPASRAVIEADAAPVAQPHDAPSVVRHRKREPREEKLRDTGSKKAPPELQPEAPKPDHSGGLVAVARYEVEASRFASSRPGVGELSLRAIGPVASGSDAEGWRDRAARPGAELARDDDARRATWRGGFDANDVAARVVPASFRVQASWPEASRSSTGPRARAADTAVAAETRVAVDRSREELPVAGWALAPERDRLVGASVAPAPSAGTAPGGIGIVAQLDVGKALLRM